MKEPVMTIFVEVKPSVGLSGENVSVNLLPFHARAEGVLFNGETVIDGIDTQVFKDGQFSMSARYLLEGEDFEGNKCRVFIENNGTTLEDCKPTLYTDSKAISFLMEKELTAKGEKTVSGIMIRIYSPDAKD